jgi:hypothetical protein
MAMAAQDWLAAGVYLMGLAAVVLLISTLSMRATHIRKAPSRTRD